MKNFETSIPSIAVYNLIFLSVMVFFTWRISSRILRNWIRQWKKQKMLF